MGGNSAAAVVVGGGCASFVHNHGDSCWASRRWGGLVAAVGLGDRAGCHWPLGDADLASWRVRLPPLALISSTVNAAAADGFVRR